MANVFNSINSTVQFISRDKERTDISVGFKQGKWTLREILDIYYTAAFVQKQRWRLLYLIFVRCKCIMVERVAELANGKFLCFEMISDN